MAVVKKIYYYFLLSLLVALFCLNSAYAITIKRTYVFYSQSKAEISKDIKDYIDKHKGRLHKYDEEEGYYYFQPRYMGTYTKGNYVMLGLRQIGGDTLLYTQNIYSTEIHLTKILKYLKKQGFSPLEIKDKELIAQMDSFTNINVFPYKNTDFPDGKDYVVNNDIKKREEKVGREEAVSSRTEIADKARLNSEITEKALNNDYNYERRTVVEVEEKNVIRNSFIKSAIDFGFDCLLFGIFF